MFEEMKKENVKVGKDTILAFFKGCATNRDKNSLELFLSKYHNLLAPDSEIYGSLLHAIANSYVPPIQKKKYELDITESDHDLQSVDNSDMESEDSLYSSAWKLFNRMKQLDIKKDRTTYTAMIELCGRRGNIKKADLLARQMKEEGIKPDLKTYRSLILNCLNHNYYNKEEEYNHINDITHPNTIKAFDLFAEMNGRQFFPSVKSLKGHTITFISPNYNLTNHAFYLYSHTQP